MVVTTSDLFVDTSGWGSLADRNEPFHRQATSIYQDALSRGRRLITTNYCMAELVSLLISPLWTPRAQLISTVGRLRSSSAVTIIHVDEATDQAAWDLLTRRPDKEWSLVDCASFVVMERMGLTDALATDHHFEQAGLRYLLKR